MAENLNELAKVICAALGWTWIDASMSMEQSLREAARTASAHFFGEGAPVPAKDAGTNLVAALRAVLESGGSEYTVSRAWAALKAIEEAAR